MKLLPLLLASTATATDYFLRFTPTSLTPSTVPPWLTLTRLRTNATISPTLPAPPYNPADHFARFTPSSPADPYTPLVVVATNPHPPPVPGYLGLSDKDGVSEAYRAVESWRVEEEGPGFVYKEWQVVEVKGGRCKPGRTVLRYKPVGGGAWGWFAVKEGARCKSIFFFFFFLGFDLALGFGGQ